MATIRSVMKTELLTVGPKDPVRKALELLIEHSITGLPVIREDRTIVGVLSEKDVLKIFYEDAPNVAALMTPNPQSVAVDAPLVDVVDILMANNFRRVLIHENGRLVGLVSRADLMPALLEVLLERTPEDA